MLINPILQACCFVSDVVHDHAFNEMEVRNYKSGIKQLEQTRNEFQQIPPFSQPYYSRLHGLDVKVVSGSAHKVRVASCGFRLQASGV